jgi:hypothetical protein
MQERNIQVEIICSAMNNSSRKIMWQVYQYPNVSKNDFQKDRQRASPFERV